MKKTIRSIIASTLALLIVVASLNLTLLASANTETKSYLGSDIQLMDTFEYPAGQSLDTIWQTTLYNGEANNKGANLSNIAAYPQVVQDPTDSSNKVLKLGTVGASKVGNVLYTLKESLIPLERKVVSFAFDLYKPTTTNPLYFVYYKGADKSNPSVELCNTLAFPVADGKQVQLCSNATQKAFQLGGMNAFVAKSWTRVKIELRYDSNGVATAGAITIGNARNSFSFKEEYGTVGSSHTDNSGYTYGFVLGSNECYVDNVTFNYECVEGDLETEIADAFCNSFARELAMSIDEVDYTNVGHRFWLNRAITEYDTLPDGAKALLTSEKATLDALLAEIENDRVAEEIADYREKYADILSKDANSVVAADMAAIVAARDALLLLSYNARSKMTSEKEKFDSMIRKLNGSNIDKEILTDKAWELFDDFEYDNGVTPTDIYETTTFNSDGSQTGSKAIKGSVVADPMDSTNKVLKLAAGDSMQKDMYGLNSLYKPTNRQIKSVSYKLYTYTSDQNYNIGFAFYRGNLKGGGYGQTSLAFSSGRGVIIYANASSTVRSANAKITPIANTWCDVNIEYLYSGEKLYGFEISLDNGTEKSVYTYDFRGSPASSARMLSEGFDFGFGFSQGSGTSFVDDVRFVFSQNETEEASSTSKAFRDEHNAILSKAPSTVGQADKQAVLAAIKDFGKLSVPAMALLNTESEALKAMAEILYPTEISALQSFITTYKASVFDKEIDTFNKNNLDTLKAAYDAYEDLSDIGKAFAKAYKNHIDEALIYINDHPETRQNGDYTSTNIDFEYYQNPLAREDEAYISDVGQYESEVLVPDPSPDGNPDNTVFRVWNTYANSGMVWYVLPDEFWPTGPTQIKRLSFRMYQESPPTTSRPIFAHAYQDVENFEGHTYQAHSDISLGGIQGYNYVDGEVKLNVYNNGISKLSFGVWTTFTYTFTDSQVIISAVSEKNAFSHTITYTGGRKIAFGYKSPPNVAANPYYIDDINIQYAKGDFDVDEEITEIKAYYSGNTVIRPDETVTITGEKLYSTLNSAEVYTLPNVPSTIDPNNPQYIFETDYNWAELQEGVVTQPTTARWNAADAAALEFVQRTINSVKFTLDASLDMGVYAIKLNPSFSSAQPKYIYLNNADIAYLMGDDGNESTTGGFVRIIGSNLYLDNKTPLVTIKSITTGVCYQLEVDLESLNDSYAVKAKIPDNLPVGKYEVYIHNGYGDNTCWSEPFVCTVKEQQDREVWRAKGFYNIVDYGAVPQFGSQQPPNSTAAIVAAINAAYKNGGGIVYVPAGMYRVISTIIIPPNVTIMGESMQTSMIYWTPERWQYGDARMLFSIQGHVEVCNLSIYASRLKQIVKKNVDVPDQHATTSIYGDEDDRSKDDIYFHDLRIRTAPLSGNYTSGGNGFGYTDRWDKEAAKVAFINECNNAKIWLTSGINQQVKNVDYYHDHASEFSGSTVTVSGYYVQVSNITTGGGPFGGFTHYSTYEDCHLTDTCMHMDGGNVYIARNTYNMKFTNNREMLLSDGQPAYTKKRIQFIGAREDIVGVGNTDDVTYKLLGYNATSFKKHEFRSMYIYVTKGQGQGQIRRIVSSERDGTLVVDSPFLVSPNRNSEITIFRPRANTYVTDCKFIDAGICGPYGYYVGVVLDGNTFEYCGGQYYFPNNWYFTILNEKFLNPVYVHGEGNGGIVGGAQTKSAIQITGSGTHDERGSMAFTFKNNDFGASIFYFDTHVTIQTIHDVVIEHNTMTKATTGLYGSSQGKVDGIYIRNNDFDVSGELYSPLFYSTEINKFGSRRIIIVDENFDSDLHGDVNQDGRVSLKDSTLISYYCLYMVDLNRKQLVKADVNADGKVDNKDDARIRQYLLNPNEVTLDKSASGVVPQGRPSISGSTSGSSGTTSSDISDGNASNMTSDGSFYPGDY